MTKKEFIAEFSKKTGIRKNKAEIFIKNFLELIEEALLKEEEVKFIGFGTWQTKRRAAKEVLNPNTREKMKIGAKNIVKFKVGKNLAEKIEKYI